MAIKIVLNIQNRWNDNIIEFIYVFIQLKIYIFFFSLRALALPPRINVGATSALWLTSTGAPLDCRLVLGWQGVRRAGTSKGQNKVKARWIGDDPRVISHSDPSSGDSIEPIRSQVSRHPPGIVDTTAGAYHRH